jgi:hypothetical protein
MSISLCSDENRQRIPDEPSSERSSEVPAPPTWDRRSLVPVWFVVAVASAVTDSVFGSTVVLHRGSPISAGNNVPSEYH